MDVTKYLDGEGSEPQWYKMYPEGAENSPQLKILILTPKRIDSLYEQCSGNKFTGRRNQRQFDNRKFLRAILTEMVLDWKFIDGPDETPLECNIQHKMKLDEQWTQFRQTWFTVYLEGEDAEYLLVEEERKN